MSATEGDQSKSMHGCQNPKKRQRVSLDIKGKTASKVEAAAQEYGCSASDILRRALEAFLDENNVTGAKESLATSRDTHELRRLLDYGFFCLSRLDRRLNSSAHHNDKGALRKDLFELTQQVTKLVTERTQIEK